jgi:hypothetical protein
MSQSRKSVKLSEKDLTQNSIQEKIPNDYAETIQKENQFHVAHDIQSSASDELTTSAKFVLDADF